MKGSKLTITLCLIKLDRKILSRQVFHDNENCGCKKQNGNCLHFDKILRRDRRKYSFWEFVEESRAQVDSQAFVAEIY